MVLSEEQKQAKSVWMRQYYQRNKNQIKAIQKTRYNAKKSQWTGKTDAEKEAIRVKQRESSKKLYDKTSESRKSAMKDYYYANRDQLKIRRAAAKAAKAAAVIAV